MAASLECNWFIISAKSDNSLSLVYEKNILKAGADAIEVGDIVGFFSRGEHCSGQVCFKDRKFYSLLLCSYLPLPNLKSCK